MRALLVCLALAAACSDDAPPDPPPADVLLSIDVALSDGGVTVFATEPERPCECSVGWTQLGDCRTQSDGIDCACNPWPASCLEEVVLLAAGETLARATWDPMWWGAILPDDSGAADELAITGCGTAAVVAIPERVRPEVSLELIDPEAERPVVVWTTEPAAASAVVSAGDGYAGDSCHRLGGSGELEIPDLEEWSVAVTALARPVFNATPLGDVRLWFGSSDRLAGQ
jgi:hypothetical protein